MKSLGERAALRSYMGVLEVINELEPELARLTDEELKAWTGVLRERAAREWSVGSADVLLKASTTTVAVTEGGTAKEAKGQSPKDSRTRSSHVDSSRPLPLLPLAFAVVREASKRVLNMRHYDVQMLGGMALATGQITEMRTGEGKTLVAILPAYLYALRGNGAHVVTVNDYLAQRDAEWVGKVLSFLGMTVGVVTSKTPQRRRRSELLADVTYLTAYELAFMYLQDNSAPPSFPIALSRPLHYAVVDEVDSILIDEARNPFIVNMPGAEGGDYESVWKVAVRVAMGLEGPRGVRGMRADELVRYFDGVPMEEFMVGADFIPEPRIKGATLTRRGMARAVEMLVRAGVAYLAVRGERGEGNEEEGVWYGVLVEDGEMAMVWELKTVDNWFGMDEETGVDASRGGRVGGSYATLYLSGGNGMIDDSDADADAGSGFDTGYDSGSTENEIRRLLADRGLRVVDADEISPGHDVWHLAVPAVLWSSSKAWGRFLNQAVRAVHVFQKDVDYIVRGGEIVVIDTATGRERERSRWQSGLHQAIEAKEMLLNADEELRIRPEDFDQGKITYQVLFSEYATLSGMTGTAATEAEEFEEAYGLSVVRIPPHRPSLRVDYPPEVYGGKPAWAEAVVKVVREAIERDRPVLVGTMSVEASEEVHKILSNTPMGDVTLSDVDRVALAAALSRAPRALPPPPVERVGGENGTESDRDSETESLENALAFYRGLMVDYDGVVDFIESAVCRDQRDAGVSLDPEDVRYALMVLRNAISARAWSFANQTEFDAVKECYEVLLGALGSATLSKSHVINLLNARPERSRKEAEIIAQAGVPGTITVATSMAGRGTDILLGGNPKGLVLSTLKYLFEDRLFSGVSRDSSDQEVPLGRVHPAFVDRESSMRVHLPDAVFSAYLGCSTELAGLDIEATFIDDIPETFFDMVVEKTELIRSHLKLQMTGATGLTGTTGTTSPPNSSSKAMIASFSKAFDAEDWSAFADSTVADRGMVSQLEAEVPHDTFRGLLKYALLQWAWFDAQCDAMGDRVRESGGLCVVIASVPESRRAELQLRGRAGRQGDPGQTHIIASLEDPILGAALLPNQQKDIWRYIEESGTSNEPLPSLVIGPIIKSVTRNQEQLQQGGRDVSRKYDAVIDSYRRHVYRLRRILTRGSEVARADLFHDNLRDLAEDLVDLHCGDTRSGSGIGSGRGTARWDVEGLVDDMIRLLEDVRGEGMDGASFVPRAKDASMSMHLIEDDYIVALLDEIDEIDGIDEIDEIDEGDTDPANTPRGVASQLRVALSSLRFSLAPSTSSLPTFDFRKTAIPIPLARTNAMHHARQRRRDAPQTPPAHSIRCTDRKAAVLASWVGDVLCSMYETKRSITVEALVCSKLTTQPLNAFQAAAIVRVWERDAALDCIDSLWSDFLQDVAVLQQASQGRAFSMFDPVDEFRLESAKAFSSLLRRYSAIVSSRLLGRVDLTHLRYLETSSGGRGGDAGGASRLSQDDVNLDFVLEEMDTFL